jgi:hypothetical protein
MFIKSILCLFSHAKSDTFKIVTNEKVAHGPTLVRRVGPNVVVLSPLFRHFFVNNIFTLPAMNLKGLSHEIDFKNVDENGQILALLRAAAGF